MPVFLDPQDIFWQIFFIFLVLWAFSEFVRNSVLGGFSFYISHAQAFCPVMLKLYGIFGCLGMSGIIFLVNSLIYSSHRIQAVQILILLSAAGHFFGGLSWLGFSKNEPALQLSAACVSVLFKRISHRWKKWTWIFLTAMPRCICI